MTELVDSSVWIDYFRSGKNSQNLDILIDENLVATNDLILTELVPPLRLHNQRKIVQLLHTIYKIELSIQWDQLIDWQNRCLKGGINGIGISDLIIKVFKGNFKLATDPRGLTRIKVYCFFWRRATALNPKI